MPKRDPKTGRFLRSAATGKTTDPGSRTAKPAGKRSRTGKDAVGIHTIRRCVRGRVIIGGGNIGTLA